MLIRVLLLIPSPFLLALCSLFSSSIGAHCKANHGARLALACPDRETLHIKTRCTCRGRAALPNSCVCVFLRFPCL
ncbi:hypothetical protein HDV57DRAFT_491020, partial [Trichoderma longibrachiatum]